MALEPPPKRPQPFSPALIVHDPEKEIEHFLREITFRQGNTSFGFVPRGRAPRSLAPTAARAALLALLAGGTLAGCSRDDCRDETSPPPGSQVDWSEIACAGQPVCAPLRLCGAFDKSLAPDVRAIVVEAFADWQAATRGAVVFVGGPPCVSFGVDMRSDDDPVFAEGGSPRSYTDAQGVHLNRDQLCGSRALRYVTRHEVGHVLGLSHAPAGDSIMRPVYSPDGSVIAVQTVDVANYLGLRGCCPK